MGFIYRIFLSRTIGAEGVGLYQIALSVFAVLLTVSCSGTPITVSRLMTKYKAQNENLKAQDVISSGIFLTLLFAVPIFIVMFFFHDAFSFLFTDERCMDIFLVIMPGLIFTSVYAVLRGVFWGNKDFLPYSIIELLEEIVMIIVGVILIKNATSAYDGAVKAGIAVLVSYVFSFVVATITFIIRGGKLKNPKNEFKPLASSALPITAMRTANSFINSLVAIILPLRLVAAGMTNQEALSTFGSAFGMAMPLLFVPVTLIGSFTLVLVPEISESFYKKHKINLKNNLEKALKFSITIACLFVPVFFVFGKELGLLIFNNYDGGVYLSHAAILMLPMTISSITTSMLNSIGYETRTLVYYVISTLFMIACIWFLPKFIGIYSLLLGFAIVFVLTSVLNLRLLNKKSGVKINYLKFLSVSLIFLLPTALLGILYKRLIINVFGNLLSVIIGSILLFVFNFLLYYCFAFSELKPIISKIFKSKQKFKTQN